MFKAFNQIASFKLQITKFVDAFLYFYRGIMFDGVIAWMVYS